MEFNKAVSNPMLVGCIQLLREADTAEHRTMFGEELDKAVFISPAATDPEPEKGPDGEWVIAPKTKVQFPLITAPDGRKFYMAFTDVPEYEKWKAQTKDLPFFTLTLDDYAAMMLRVGPDGTPNPAAGLVINPVGENMIIPKDTIANLMTLKILRVRQGMGPAGNPGMDE